MNRFRFQKTACAFGAALLLACTYQSANAADDEDMTIRPGVGIGELHLGMTQAQINKVLGKPDGEYKLSNGIQAEYSEWKETNSVSTVRIFFDAAGKAVQIAYEQSGKGPHPNSKLHATGGLTLASTYADVTHKYGALKHNEYRLKTGQGESLDAEKQGIAFEFAYPAGQASNKKLYAIVVHQPGKPVLPDANERHL